MGLSDKDYDKGIHVTQSLRDHPKYVIARMAAYKIWGRSRRCREFLELSELVVMGMTSILEAEKTAPVGAPKAYFFKAAERGLISRVIRPIYSEKRGVVLLSKDPYTQEDGTYVDPLATISDENATPYEDTEATDAVRQLKKRIHDFAHTRKRPKPVIDYLTLYLDDTSDFYMEGTKCAEYLGFSKQLGGQIIKRFRDYLKSFPCKE